MSGTRGRKAVGAGIFLLVAGLLLFILWPNPRSGKTSPPPGAAPGAPAATTPPPPTPPPARDFDEVYTKASAALGGGQTGVIGTLAAQWRKSARTDPEFRRRLIRYLQDETVNAGVRELAAFVLGTIPEPEGLKALGDALAAARDPKRIRALLLALGCDRTSGDDDDIFALPDTPRVLAVPLGISVRVRGAIDERDLRDRMLPHLRTETSGVRWAAALALADSTSHAEVRGSFLESIPGERDPATQGELSKALADWAAGEPGDSPERQRIFTAIFEGANRDDAAALRLRSEDGLKRMPWTSVEVRLMTGRVESGTLDQRRWAIAVLSGAAGRPETPDRELVFETLATASASSPEAKVRELAVTGLSSFTDQARVSGVLLTSLGDGAWHVRAAAARALGRVGGSPEILEALQKAELQDADERVRKIAGEVRRNLGAK